MLYPNSTDTKRPPLEYSASSAKYLNNSLTFTPSQYQANEDQNASMQIDMKSVTKIKLKYDHLTPVQNNRQPKEEEEDIDKAYEYLTG